MDYKKLGAAIGAALKKSELSASVGEFCGVTRNAVNGWVYDGSRPADKNMTGYFRLIKALKIDALEFADFETPAGRITLLRFKNEFSISDLMQRCGKSRSIFSELESGARIVSTHHTKYLAPALNTTSNYILHGDKKIEPLRNGLVSVEFPIAKQIVLDAKSIGVTFYLKDGDLFAKPSGLLNDPIRLKIREHRVQLIDFLSQNPLLCTAPVDNFESTPTFKIDIYIKNIGDDEVNAVNARELWARLGVATRFSDWIKRRIEMYAFAENTEWIALPINEKRENKGFQTAIDYFISLDMAKELSMVENSDQGKAARRYFIACEKQAKTITPKIDHLSPEVIAVLKQARTVQLAMGMTKVQSREYAADLIQDRFGFDMACATTGSRDEQLRLRIVK